MAAPAKPQAVPPAVQYLALLHEGIERAREQMPVVIESTNTAARLVCAGGNIYAGGSQPEFAAELLGRGGGLMDLRALSQGRPTRGDVVLYGARSRLGPGDLLTIDRLRREGVYVVAFASADLSANRFFAPDALIDSGPSEGLPVANGQRICPTDTVINLLNAWTWTGEFVAACTRQGKMPILYQDFALPGAYRRAALYRSVTMFHDDVTVTPIDPGILGTHYLDCIERYLASLREESAESLRVAGTWLRDAGPQRATALFAGRLFPDHFRDRRAAHPFEVTSPLTTDRMPRSALVLVLGCHHPPQLMVDAALMRRLKLIYAARRRARDDGGMNVIYLDPRFSADDACVAIDEYDIPLLPASSVMQGAIYWSLVAEAMTR